MNAFDKYGINYDKSVNNPFESEAAWKRLQNRAKNLKMYQMDELGSKMLGRASRAAQEEKQVEFKEWANANRKLSDAIKEEQRKEKLAKRREKGLARIIEQERRDAIAEEKKKISSKVNDNVKRSSKSLYFNVENEVNKILKFTDKYLNVSRPPELAQAMMTLRSDITDALNKYSESYFKYMMPAVEENIQKNSEYIREAIEVAIDSLGVDLTEQDIVQIYSSTIRELSDGRLKPFQIERKVYDKVDLCGRRVK